MNKKYNYYVLYMIFVLVWNMLFIAAPFIAASGDKGTAGVIYKGFTPFCHQLPQRSFCLIQPPAGGSYVADCVQEDTRAIDRYTYTDSRGTGYEFAVDARDNAIYIMMFLAGLAYPFIRRVDDDRMPPLWLFVLALIPIGLDGTTQLVGWRESTNTLRVITGAIAGTAVAFYAIPLLYYFIPIAKDAFLRRK